jgi:hypothetical protein
MGELGPERVPANLFYRVLVLLLFSIAAAFTLILFLIFAWMLYFGAFPQG